jgi:thiol-disulfide isomerase/thioredoxin
MALLEFYGTECPHCTRMAPLVEKLRGEGFAVEQFETWHDKKNAEKLAEYDRGFCGGVPFFFNTESATDYDRLRAWAEGK